MQQIPALIHSEIVIYFCLFLSAYLVYRLQCNIKSHVSSESQSIKHDVLY